MTTKLSPAMAQFMAAKEEQPDALLFFRMGDFYELFYEDAKTAAKALGITLTSRNKGGDNPIPMAGVPVRAADNYLKRLVQSGYKVAICEQMQDPKDVKGVVDRQIVRVMTPGTLTEDNLLEDDRANYLAAVTVSKNVLGIAWVELSTGCFQTLELPADRLVDELTRLDPAEVLVPEDSALCDQVRQLTSVPMTQRSAYEFGFDTAGRALTEFFKTKNLDGFGLGELRQGIGAAGALIAYLEETQLAALPHIRRIELFPDSQLMRLDRATRNSLELVETMRGDGSGTPLLKVLDRTATPMGARLLREQLLSPLTTIPEIILRQGAVEELHDHPSRTSELHEALDNVLDLQRLTTRISCGRANARDLASLGSSLAQLPGIRTKLESCQSQGLGAVLQGLDPLDDLAEAITSTLADDPPITVKEGGLIASGVNAELDELRVLSQDSKSWIASYQAEEAERLGIPNLKVGFNKVFGYYLEVTAASAHVELPPEYVRKQTTKNAERYITDALKEFETKVLKADENAKDLEYRLFLELRDRISAETARLQATAEQIAQLDVFVGLALVAKENNYCLPHVVEEPVLDIVDGRHPVIEATHAKGTFVPNDTRLSAPERKLALLTGPNMAGKSTYIRQTALITLMAQVGSFVPAKSAKVGIVDRIFTRVGGADDISQGASTFMVEMTETANILNNATARSLVILDEVGRGTSTFDGLSLAWAIAENLVDVIGCRSLFATHYHQMTDLASPERGVVNQRVAVKEWGDEIVFLHRIEDGGTDKSYGLHVGRLAGLPKTVLERAKAILDRLEEDGQHVRESLDGLDETPARSEKTAKPAERQLSLFESPRERVLKELQKLRTAEMTPMAALQKLAEWEELLR